MAHRELYRQSKAEFLTKSSAPSVNLAAYQKQYQKEFSAGQTHVTTQDLVNDISSSDIAVFADYHTLRRSQEAVARLISQAVPFLYQQGKQPVLALEMLRVDDWQAVGRYLSGKSDQHRFLKQIEFKRRWGVNWEGYRDLISYAAKLGVRICGLSANRDSSLASRDKFAAHQLAKLSKARHTFVFALFGELHLAKDHLPMQLHSELAKHGLNRKVTLIHQNVDSVYWKSERDSGATSERVVSLGKNRYCLLNTPPWLKMHSYNRWAGDGCEDGAANEIDYTEQLRDILEQVGRVLAVDTSKCDTFKIVWSPEVPFLRSLGRSYDLTASQLYTLIQHNVARRTVFVPRANLLLIGSTDLTTAVHEAAVAMLYQGISNTVLSHSSLDQFYQSALAHAFGFLSSKIYNPNRGTVSTTVPVHAHLGAAVHRQMEVAGDYTPFSHKRFLNSGWLPLNISDVERSYLIDETAKVLGCDLGNELFRMLLQDRLPTTFAPQLLKSLPKSELCRRLYFTTAKRFAHNAPHTTYDAVSTAA